MSGVSCPNPDHGFVAADSGPVLSGRLAVMRSGQHLARIAQNLRDLELMMITVERSGQTAPGEGINFRRSRLQALDLMIQELTGLSDILIGAASHLSDAPDRAIDALVDLPRLQSLSRALRDQEAKASPSEVVIF